MNNSAENIMTKIVNEVTKDQLAGQFEAVVAETEQLLNSVANAGGEKAGALRASVEQNLAAAKETLREFQQAATARTRAAAHATDEYVHANPWRSVGIAAGFGAVIGLMIGLLNRR
jgi:ElaB/YqjD/DUF883 family membrane-anchored ribosome-binding protein